MVTRTLSLRETQAAGSALIETGAPIGCHFVTAISGIGFRIVPQRPRCSAAPSPQPFGDETKPTERSSIS